MDLNQIRYFIAIAREGTMTKAAKNLYITQPALSKALSKLEEDLGFPLFNRRRGKIELTPAGQIFLDNVEPALRSMEKAVSAARAQFGQGARNITIGYSIIFPISNIITEYRRLHPDSIITQNAFTPDQLFQELLEGGIDFAITSAHESNPYLSSDSFMRFPPALSLSNINPLTEAPHICLGDLANESFVCETDIIDRRVLQSICAESDFSPRVIMESSDRRVLTPIFKTAPVVTFIPMMIAYDKLCVHREALSEEAVRMLHGCKHRLELSLVTNKSNPPAGAALGFYEFVRQSLAELESDVAHFLSEHSGGLFH